MRIYIALFVVTSILSTLSLADSKPVTSKKPIVCHAVSYASGEMDYGDYKEIDLTFDGRAGQLVKTTTRGNVLVGVREDHLRQNEYILDVHPNYGQTDGVPTQIGADSIDGKASLEIKGNGYFAVSCKSN